MKNSIPSHLGVIPGGQRRWADSRGLPYHEAFASAMKPGLDLFKACRKAGVQELTVFGSALRGEEHPEEHPKEEAQASAKTWAQAVGELREAGAAVLVVGDERGGGFPAELKAFTKRSAGALKVNVLLNYGCDWDLEGLKGGSLRSGEIPRLDLVLRWGGKPCLGGFLPVQSANASLLVVDELWPDFHVDHLEQAFSWYRSQARESSRKK